jgi:uncharacterized membrane protein (UPF0127 family)
MKTIEILEIQNVTRETCLATHARVADTSWSRARGLIGTPALPPGHALLIDPSMGIHTCFMSYPIDVVYVDVDDQVVDVDEEMPPWRLGKLRFKAIYVIELPAGTVKTTRTQPGDQLNLRRLPQEAELIREPEPAIA